MYLSPPIDPELESIVDSIDISSGAIQPTPPTGKPGMEDKRNAAASVDAAFASPIWTSMRRHVVNEGEGLLEQVRMSEGLSLRLAALSVVDASISAADPLGDGDQTFVEGDFPSQRGSHLRQFWSNGGDFIAIINSGSWDPHVIFHRCCYFGQADSVKALIDSTAPNSEEMKQLLEGRVSVLRNSPLISCVAGARRSMPAPADHLRTADLLCAAGARVNSRDIAGFAPTQHATTSYASADSLAIYNLLVHKYGADPNDKNRFGNELHCEAFTSRRMDILETVMNAGITICPTARQLMTFWAEAQVVVSYSEEAHRRRRLQPGDICKLVALKKTELNGKYGTLLEMNYRTGRWGFQPLAEEGEAVGKAMAVARANLIYAGCERCGVKSKLRCSKCERIYYCSADCQREHWPAHKTVCKKAKSHTTHVLQPTMPQSMDVANDEGSVMALYAQKCMVQLSAKSRPFQIGAKITNCKKHADGDLEFLVKAQIPLDLRKGHIMVYNEDRTFGALVYSADFPPVPPLKCNPQYDELYNFIRTHGLLNGVKTYLTCKYNEKTKVGKLLLNMDNVDQSFKW